jgi:hypothetical protein
VFALQISYFYITHWATAPFPSFEFKTGILLTRQSGKMEKLALPKSPHRKRWCIGLSIFAILVIIIVIVVPLAVILPRKGHNGSKSTVILPLYIYPNTTTAWNPLYEV